MDNGEVIPGLNEDWTLGGAKIAEWVAGFAAFMIASESFYGGPSGKAMPQLLAIWMGTTFGLALFRRKFPDEERGLRNHVLTSVGIAPPGIPTPAALQPYWSGCLIHEPNKDWNLVKLGILEVLEEIRESKSTDPEKVD